LQWETSIDPDFYLYEIYRDGVLIATSDIQTTNNYLDVDVTNNISYEYYIVVIDVSDNILDQTDVITVTPFKPGPILSALAGDGQVTLNWTEDSDLKFDHYEIFRDGSFYQTIPLQSTTVNVDSGVVNFTEYSYKIKTVDVSGNSSAFSNIVSVTPVDNYSNILLWLDAQSLALDNGDRVAQWSDLSKYGNHATQNNLADQPQFINDLVSGKPGVQFNWEHLLMPDIVVGTDYTIVLVAPFPQLHGSSKTYMLCNNASQSNSHMLLYNDEFSIHNTSDNLGSGYYQSFLSIGTHVVSYVIDSTAGDTKIYIDSILVGSISTTQIVNINRIGMGEWYPGGDIGEILVYDNNLSAADRLNIENSLINKWGI